MRAIEELTLDTPIAQTYTAARIHAPFRIESLEHWGPTARRAACTGSWAQRLVHALHLEDAVTRSGADWDEQDAKAIAGAIRQRPVADLLSALETTGVWAEHCRRDVERAVLHDPNLISAGTVYCSTHPDYGQLREIGPLFRFSRSRRAGHGYAPLRGQHTRELLAELGYETATIDEFYARKIVA